MKIIFKDETFSFELLRTIGQSVYEGADIGECISTAYRIKEGDFESWYVEWYKTAMRVFKTAEGCMRDGRMVSAREAYLRASNYFRTAEFFLHENHNDKRALECWEKSQESFRKAGELFSPTFEKVMIPYEGTTLPGYFFRADDSGSPKPTMIAMTGFDGTAEEMYFMAGAAAMRRGYNVLAFEGPGQGAALRKQNLYFRHDWENVVTPVVDFLAGKQEVDAARIILMGYSFGGYLAPRAAAFEPRIAACVADSGIYSFFDACLGARANSRFTQREMEKDKSVLTDVSTNLVMKFNTSLRWSIMDGLWKFNVDTPHKLLKEYRKYTLEGVVEKIKCPVLICDSEDEHFFGKQAMLLYEKLECPKEFMYFTREDAAAAHCQCGALLLSNQRILDWVDKVTAH